MRPKFTLDYQPYAKIARINGKIYMRRCNETEWYEVQLEVGNKANFQVHPAPEANPRLKGEPT